MSTPISIDQQRRGLVRHDHPDTSHEAAATIPTGERRVKVLRAVASAGNTGETAEQIAYVARLSGDTVRPRLIELRGGGWVERLEQTFPTRSGKRARRWRITDSGRLALAELGPESDPSNP